MVCHIALIRTPSHGPHWHAQSVDMGVWFDSFSDKQSDPGDPMPLAPPATSTSLPGGCVNAAGLPCNVYTLVGFAVGALLECAAAAAAGGARERQATVPPIHSSQQLTYPNMHTTAPSLPFCRGVTDQLVAVVVRIERFWRPALINSVLPVILVFFLAMFIFFTGGLKGTKVGAGLVFV